MNNFHNLISKSLRSIDIDELKSIVSVNLRPSIKIVILMILATGIAYPLLLVAIGQVTLPFQSNGSLLMLDVKVIGSKLIAQEFKSDKFFHSRPAAEFYFWSRPPYYPRRSLLTGSSNKCRNWTRSKYSEDSNSA